MQNSPRSSIAGSPKPLGLLELYLLAEESRIPVYWYPMGTTMESLVVQLQDGSAAIALDPAKLAGLGDEKYKLAHELGHSLTGALYCRDTPLDERGRNEQRADRWAIERLLPFPQLQAALEAGRTGLAELAEYFDLPPALVEKAIAYYTGPKGLHLPEDPAE